MVKNFTLFAIEKIEKKNCMRKEAVMLLGDKKIYNWIQEGFLFKEKI